MRRLHIWSRIRALLLALTLTITSILVPQRIHAAGEISWSVAQIPLTQTLQTPLKTSITTTSITLTNAAAPTGRPGTYRITFPNLPGGWTGTTTLQNPFQLAAGQAVALSIKIDIPDNATPGKYVITIRVAGDDTTTAGVSADTFIDLNLNPPGTPPVLTGTCPEPSDPGGDQGGATLILVDKEEGHGICNRGDEDWYKFGALGGKYYTIDITTMDKGLDLALELYDENGKLIDADDDFPRTEDPTQLQQNSRPKIQSFRAPVSGFYYFRVRDTLGLGGANLTYRVVVNGEGYGNLNPPPVASLCNDLYEPDGLPEQASTIKPNDTQKTHRLCPAGDADWIKFFALAGYTYFIYTDSRDNGAPIPGADPIMFLFNRDGQTLIDFNNNIIGGTSLDASVTFRPSADGIYFIQIKNVGDIGDIKIVYSLTVKACPPEQLECGPPDIVKPKPAPGQPLAGVPGSGVGAQQPAPVPQAPPQFLDATVPGAKRSQITLSPSTQTTFEPTTLANTPSVQPVNVSDPAFQQLWQRSDLPIIRQRITRGWLWGPTVRLARTESYAQANGGLRQVMYFDKGRMELNNPAGDRKSNWFVSSGLLVQELISGQIQLGTAEYAARGSADLAMVGDINDPNAPTYASLAGLTGRATDRTGQSVDETLNRAGQIGSYTGSTSGDMRFTHFVGETSHNIPAVFWNYLNSSGTVYTSNSYYNDKLFDWVATVGYPLSEPYWTRVRVGGIERDVLVQAFERRVLTYTPDNDPNWRVQLGNVGRHYYLWRYGEELPG